jgi:hypothetical protein
MDMNEKSLTASLGLNDTAANVAQRIHSEAKSLVSWAKCEGYQIDNASGQT